MYQIRKMLAQAGIDGFLALLIAAVVLAWLAPEIGVGDGAFSLSSIANYGISVIFFFYGLRLTREKLRKGLGNWKLHVLIQLTSFVLFPLLILPLRPLFQGDDNILLWLGIFYLAVLPSTVSSSVVMVSIAKGNIPAAIFNASISSLIGIFITPMLMSMFLLNVAAGTELWTIIGKLILQIFIPVAFGMMLNRRWGSFAEKHGRKLRMFDQSVILLIVYTSFCASFAYNIFENFSWIVIIVCTFMMVILFFVVYGIVKFICRRFEMNREDTITALFCGSKKSLVHGTAMAKVIFAGYGGIGVILLPIMLYHTFQLMIVSAIAKKYSKNITISDH